MSNKPPQKREVELYFKNILDKNIDNTKWDAKIMDKYLYHFPNLYLKFVSDYEFNKRRK